MKHKYYVLGYQMFFYFYASVKIIKLSNLFKMRHFVSLVYISNKLFYCDFIFLVIAYYQFNNMTNIILLFSKKYIYFCYFFMDKKCHGYTFLIFFNLLDLLVKTFKRAGATTDTKRGALKEEEGVWKEIWSIQKKGESDQPI